ncbi:MAG: MATE family efflux transporter [Myxococcales bacterium]|nr:MATE family efflux transporter [Myxococcales bacterium]
MSSSSTEEDAESDAAHCRWEAVPVSPVPDQEGTKPNEEPVVSESLELAVASEVHISSEKAQVAEVAEDTEVLEVDASEGDGEPAALRDASEAQDGDVSETTGMVPGGFREVVWLAYPVVISMMAQALLGIVDTLFMGYVSTAAQGAVGLGNMMIWMLLSFFFGLINGVSTFVSQKEGEGKEDGEHAFHEAGRYANYGLMIAVSAGLLLMTMQPLLPFFLSLIGVKSALAAPALAYSSWRLWGGIFACSNFAIISFLRGTGDTRTPMYVSFWVVFLNIPFNYIFIFGMGPIPAMGAAGAALGTIFSQIGGLLVYAWVFWSPRVHERYQTRRWHFDGREVLRLVAIGAPIGVQWVLETGSWTIFTAFVSKLGERALAAHHIVLQMLHLSFMPGVAISIAATTLVGQYVGARRKDDAERSGYSALKLAVLYMGAMSLFFAIFGREVMMLFNREPSVVKLGATLFMMAGLFQIFDALGMAATGALRGAGDTTFPMWLMIAASWGLFVPMVYFLGHVMRGGVIGAWWGAVSYISLVGIVLFFRWKRGAWRNIHIG